MILPERVLGRSAVKNDVVGTRNRTDLLDDVLFELCDELFARRRVFLERHESRHRLTLELVRTADDRRFGHQRMIDERAFHFHRADPMAGHVQHVVNTAEEPEVALLIPLRAIAGEIDVGCPSTPVPASRSVPDRRRYRGASRARAG